MQLSLIEKLLADFTQFVQLRQLPSRLERDHFREIDSLIKNQEFRSEILLSSEARQLLTIPLFEVLKYRGDIYQKGELTNSIRMLFETMREQEVDPLTPYRKVRSSLSLMALLKNGVTGNKVP